MFDPIEYGPLLCELNFHMDIGVSLSAKYAIMCHNKYVEERGN